MLMGRSEHLRFTNGVLGLIVTSGGSDLAYSPIPEGSPLPSHAITMSATARAVCVDVSCFRLSADVHSAMTLAITFIVRAKERAKGYKMIG